MTARYEALAALMDGRYGSARSGYSRYLQLHPDDLDARLEMACAQAATGDWERASETIDALATGSLAAGAGARRLLAWAYVSMMKDRSADVERDLRSAVTTDPTSALAHFALGRYLLWARRDPKTSRIHFQRASEIFPESQAAILGVVDADAEGGDFAGAVRGSRVLLRRFPA
jgi:tetratricopeptide (TPR) repeat protein